MAPAAPEPGYPTYPACPACPAWPPVDLTPGVRAEADVLRGDHDSGGIAVGSAPPTDTRTDTGPNSQRLYAPPGQAPDAHVLLATAMRLPENFRRHLADCLGDGFGVVDLHDAPASTDVVLVNPVSHQLLGLLRARFPTASIIVARIDDAALGASYPDPAAGVLHAGSSACLEARPVAGVAAAVCSRLAGSTHRVTGMSHQAHSVAA